MVKHADTTQSAKYVDVVSVASGPTKHVEQIGIKSSGVRESFAKLNKGYGYCASDRQIVHHHWQ